VDIVLGTGTSQSCLRLLTYIPRLAAADGVFDGYHPTLCPASADAPDTLVPIVWGTSEWEAVATSRPDGPLLRVWEMAGTSHVNWWEGSFGGAQGFRDLTAVGGPALLPATWDEDDAGQYGERGSRNINLAPARYAFRAAVDHLSRWARDWKEFRAGVRPADRIRPAPAAERLSRTGFMLARDGHGNALGGLRLPALDVPVATYLGEQPNGTSGQTLAFDPMTVAGLYPTHEAYVARMRTATNEAVALGFMLGADSPEWMGRVEASPIGGDW
ncbi:MAG: alpha/beta hydrolase domain-containing protein, partial [Acidimicrobiia bacterium]